MFGLSAVEERKRKRAVLIIQCAFRCYIARRHCQDHYRARYRKTFDPETSTYAYQNKKTLDIYDDLPEFFGKATDLPKPRDFLAPENYDPGSENTGNLYALILSNTFYSLGKWIPFTHIQEVDNDFDMIKSLLTHEYIGKLRPENVIAIKNPSTNDAKGAFKQLKKIVRRQGSLIVYIATHVVNIRGNKDPENKKETSYFAFRNSIWGKTKEIINSCIGLLEISNYIKQINCKEKVIMLNYAHLPPPRKAFFTSSKQIYPPADFISRFSKLCNCPVISNCSTGFKVSQYMKGYPDIKWRDIKEEGSKLRPATSLSQSAPSTVQTVHSKQILPVASAVYDLTEEDDDSMLLVKSHDSGLSYSLYKQYYSSLYEQVLDDFGLYIPKGITRSEKPPVPHPVWTQNAETGFAIKVELPDSKQIRKHHLSTHFWRIKRTFAKPFNLGRQSLRYYKRISQMTQRQFSHAYQSYTLFGYALILALKGGACRPEFEHVTLYDLFSYLYHIMTTLQSNMISATEEKKAAELALVEAESHKPLTLDEEGNQYKRNKKDEDDNDNKNKKEKKKKAKKASQVVEEQSRKIVLQTPCLYLPDLKRAGDYLNSICWFRCGPPAPPERPYVIEAKANSVLLEWFNPPFDGIAPSYYRLYMRNVTRNFSQWEEVYYPGRKIFKTKFLVRNLPLGVSCQFKVQSFNHGGWSMFSEDSTYVTPGEDTLPITKTMRWYRVRQGGVLAILDQIKLYRNNKDESLTGLKLLYGMGNNAYGYKSSKFALAIAERCFDFLHLYQKDAEIVSYAFLVLICTMLGKNERKVRQYCNTHNIEDIVKRQMELHRYHSGVVNSIQSLRNTGTMHKYLPPMTEFKYKVMFPKNINDLESESDEDMDDNDDDTVGTEGDMMLMKADDNTQ